mgnify:FL=1
MDFGEIGVRYEKSFNKLSLIGEAGTTSDKYTDVKASASYQMNDKSKVGISVGRQTKSDLTTDTISASAIINF